MTQIKLRRDTSVNFTSKNPVLGAGEPAYETDTKKLKIGDGTTAYNSLDYFAGGGGSTEFNVVQPLKLVDRTLTLQIDEQTIQVQNGKLVANLDELGNEVNTLAGDVAGVQADIFNKQDKFTANTPLSMVTNAIIATVASGITETADSYTGGGADNMVSLDVSGLNIDANSDWKICLSGHSGLWNVSTANSNVIDIHTEYGQIYRVWFGSKHFRLGVNTNTFESIPNTNGDFVYEISHAANGTQYIFSGTGLLSTTALNISDMATALNQATYTTLSGKGKITKIDFVVSPEIFDRIDKAISGSYIETNGTRYPLTTVAGSSSLQLGIGSGLSVVDGKLTAKDQVRETSVSALKNYEILASLTKYTAAYDGYVQVVLISNTTGFVNIYNVNSGLGVASYLPTRALFKAYVDVSAGDEVLLEYPGTLTHKELFNRQRGDV